MKKPKRGPGRKRGTENRKFGLPVKEADKDLTVPLLQVDIEKANAVKSDGVNDESNFLCCVLAQGFTRACGANRVWIGRRTAFIAFPGEKCTRRYRIESRSRRILEAWDRGEHIIEGVALTLKAPSKANTRAFIRKQSRKYRSENPGASGGSSGRRKTKRRQRPSDPLHNIVRNGNLVRWS